MLGMVSGLAGLQSVSVQAYQKISSDENGGLLNYATTNFDDPLLYQVNLLNAQNEAKNREQKN